MSANRVRMTGGFPYQRSSPYSNSPLFLPRSDSPARKEWSMSRAAPAEPNPEHGFQRSEMYSQNLVGTVKYYERHVFLGWTDPAAWSSTMDSAKSVPKLLAAAIKARKKDLHMETKLTMFEAKDGSEFGNGDVLIFPDMICVRQLTRYDVDTFVEEILVSNQLGRLEHYALPLSGSHIFVCCHGTRDPRSGTCGPVLVKQFREEAAALGMEDDVRVHPCSHINGHQYEGNIIIFSRLHGVVTGDWYGYVTPKDVRILVESHIGRGDVVEQLWRGRMGLTQAEQKELHEYFPKQRHTCGESETCEQCLCRQQGMGASLTDSSSPEHVMSHSMEPIERCCRMAPVAPKKPRIVLKASSLLHRGRSKSTQMRPTPEVREIKMSGSAWATRLTDRVRSWSLQRFLDHLEEDRLAFTVTVLLLSVGVSLTSAYHASRWAAHNH